MAYIRSPDLHTFVYVKTSKLIPFSKDIKDHRLILIAINLYDALELKCLNFLYSREAFLTEVSFFQ